MKYFLAMLMYLYFFYCMNITDWATINNLSLNLRKSEEIVFNDKRRKSNYQTPETCNGPKRIQHIKILCVTFTNGLSVTLHISAVNRLQRTGIVCLQASPSSWFVWHSKAVFRSVVLARFLYTSPAWQVFAGVEDRWKVERFLSRRLLLQKRTQL